jgi:hypothetical protein
LQVVELIEFFLSKLSPILKKVTLLRDDRTVETVFCTKPLNSASSKPGFERCRLHRVFCDAGLQYELTKSALEHPKTSSLCLSDEGRTDGFNVGFSLEADHAVM